MPIFAQPFAHQLLSLQRVILRLDVYCICVVQSLDLKLHSTNSSYHFLRQLSDVIIDRQKWPLRAHKLRTKRETQLSLLRMCKMRFSE